MKLGDLKAVGHNLADSLGSGVCLLIGYSFVDIYKEAAKSSAGYIEVDFLTGNVKGGRPSGALRNTIRSYKRVFPSFCQTHRVRASDVQKMTARFELVGRHPACTVTVEDTQGRGSVDEYRGQPSRRLRCLDEFGRVRKKRSRTYQV